MTDFIIQKHKLSDGSEVFDVVAVEDEDDEDEEGFVILAAKTEQHAKYCCNSLTEVVFAFGQAPTGEAAMGLCVRLIRACK